MTGRRRAGLALLACIAAAGLLAPVLAPHDPLRQFDDYAGAPPMRPRVRHADGTFGLPFVYPLRLVDRLERRFEPDTSHPARIRWFRDGLLASVDERHGPWLPLGADPVGRDVLARLLYGTRLSLGVAACASLGALLVGLLVGGPAGFFGGRLERVLMGAADFVLVLPSMYVVLAIRAALPQVLTPAQVFAALTLVLAAAGWPLAARGVRAIVAGEAAREYAEAAHAAGAGPWRILLRHLLPATLPFLASMGTLLLPAFVLTEATLSFVGLGFPVPSATWGAMLRDAWANPAFTEAPWLLAPAAAMVLTILGIHLATSSAIDSATAAQTIR